MIFFIALMVSNETADNNNDSADDENIVRPRLYLRDTQSGANGQNHRPYNQYNR